MGYTLFEMLDIALWISAALWMLALTHLLLNKWFGASIENTRAPEPADWPFVSIVVPARNEEGGIREAVESFCTQDYPRFEVLVVDDGSTDATPAILAELASKYKNLRVLSGVEPPEGWLGKVNALERGRKEAQGEWLVFSDADIVYAPGLLRKATAYALNRKAGLLFLMPRLLVGGALEAAVMSQLPLAFAVLPLWLITRTPLKAFAGGSGVFNLVRRDALEACGAFACLKDTVVDDVGLGYEVKGAGYGIAFAFAVDSLRVRMYAGAGEAVGGFTKNCYPGLKTVPVAIPLVLAIGCLMSFLPYAGLAAAAAGAAEFAAPLTALALMHLTFAAIAVLFRLPLSLTFLNPLREAAWWWILLRSYRHYHRAGGVLWRGRLTPHGDNGGT